MPIGYPEAFGLRDNPFGPRKPVEEIPARLTSEIEKKPLLVHLDSRLDLLYCDNLPSFKNACDSLEVQLNADNYTTNPMARGVSNYFVAIEGDRGAGKTTLASRMIQIMARRVPPGSEAWAIKELFLKSATDTPTEQIERLKAFHEELKTVTNGYVCVLIDDVVAETYPQITKLYEQLQTKFIVFLVMTSWDPAMKKKLDEAEHHLCRYSIPEFTADDAVAYVTARHRVFRLPQVNINAEPIFPFSAGDIHLAMKVEAAAQAREKRPLNLRIVAGIFQMALMKRLDTLSKRSPPFNIDGVPESELKSLMIQLTAAYNSTVNA